MEQIKNTWEWFKKFFEHNSAESMMRLLNFSCVRAGILIIWYCVIMQVDGAHYGLELVLAGLLGKGYQEYNIRKKETIKKENGDTV